MRTVRELWLAGNAGLLASLVLAQPTSVIVMGVADVVLAVAWIVVIYRACLSREWGWAFVMAVFPLAIWVYIFRRADEVPQPSQPAPSHDGVPIEEQPTQPLPLVGYPVVAAWTPDAPLAVRQALEVIREAEWRHPDW
jgi:hypothetical protein